MHNFKSINVGAATCRPHHIFKGKNEKMKKFKHVNAGSLGEALRLLGEYGDRAKVNAGGTDLLGVLKDRILPVYPELIINIKTIPGLDTITEDETGFRIGALTTLADICRCRPLAEKLPLLTQACAAVASPQIRNAATIGGNLCQDTRCWYYRYPDKIGGLIHCFRKGGKGCPAAAGENQYHAIMGAKRCYAVSPSDTAAALIALGATLTLADKDNGVRTVTPEELYTPTGNILGAAEILTEISIPKPPPAAMQRFQKFTQREPIDFAIVSVASLITVEQGVCTEARLVLGAVAPTPLRPSQAEKFLQGKKLTAEVAAQAADLALEGAKPLAKNGYKIDIAKTLIKRALL